MISAKQLFSKILSDTSPYRKRLASSITHIASCILDTKRADKELREFANKVTPLVSIESRFLESKIFYSRRH